MGASLMRGCSPPKIANCVNLFLLVIFIYIIRDTYLILPQPTQFQIFGFFFHLKPYSHRHSPRQHLYQKMQNFLSHLIIYLKSLPHPAPLAKRPRKNSKVNFRRWAPRKKVRVRYHWKWFLKLYILNYSALSFSHRV